MRGFVHVLLCSIFLCAVSSINSAQARSYYIDAVHGDDANPGSRQKPWKSIAMWPERKFQSGDQIFLHADQEHRGLLYLDSTNCNCKLANKPLSISTYHGKNATIIASPSAGAIVAYNISGLRISNLTIKGDQTVVQPERTRGIVISSAGQDNKGFVIRDVTVSGTNYGIYIEATADETGAQGGISDITIQSVQASQNLFALYFGGYYHSNAQLAKGMKSEGLETHQKM